jgi:HrpA-like RNA helicase
VLAILILLSCLSVKIAREAGEKSLKELDQQLGQFTEAAKQLLQDISTQRRSIKLISEQWSREIKRIRGRLPVFAFRSELVSLVQTSPYTIVEAATGSGKTTQIVQAFVKNYYYLLIIIITIIIIIFIFIYLSNVS